VFQVLGDLIACFFCGRMVFLLRQQVRYAYHQLFVLMTKPTTRDEVQIVRQHYQADQRVWLAWVFLTLGVALYAIGQILFVSYDVRTAPEAIPFPGIYDIPFVAMYPLFLLGALLLARGGAEAGGGRVRLVLDALAVVGAAFALSWFFVIGPLTLKFSGGLSATFLTFYFPSGDLLLVAVASFIVFNPFSVREQEAVFGRLFWGLGLMAMSDSLLAYEILNVDYRTGLLRILLNPLSVLFIGLAAIKYPQALAHEQERIARTAPRKAASNMQMYVSQITSSLRTISPFLLALFTCTILVTAVAPRGGIVLVQASLSALLLILLVVLRQALTMIENTRLTLQLRGELSVSQRALDRSRQEMENVSHTAQEKRVLEDGVAILRNAHARVARGDFSARATVLAGPLMPLAISFNLMLERLGSLQLQLLAYERLRRECQYLQGAVDRLSTGIPLWSSEYALAPQQSELGLVWFRLAQFQRRQQQRQHSEILVLEAVREQTQQVHDQFLELEQRRHIKGDERAAYEHIEHSIKHLQQRISHLVEQHEKTG